MNIAAARYPGRVTCLDLGSNQGKRAGMAAGIRASQREFLVCVDYYVSFQPFKAAESVVNTC